MGFGGSAGFGSSGGGVTTDIANMLEIKGSTNASTNPNYPSASVGDTYLVSVAGKVGGASGKSVEVGDMVVATADNAGGTEAAVGTSWVVMQANLAGALLGSNNLSDLVNAATARTNLGLGPLATASTPLASDNGGTGNAYTEFTGPASSKKTFTLPNASDTVACLGQQQAFTMQQNASVATLTSSSNSIAWDLSTQQSAKHTFTENTTLANPTNMVDGGTYVLRLTQHASSPKTLAFGNAYKWPNGTAFVVSATNSAIDVLTFTSDGTSMYGVGQKAFA